MFPLTPYAPSAVALGAVFAASVALTAARPRLRREERERPRFAVVAALAILVQGIHFMEELRTGLHVELPGAFDLEPIPESAFIYFNVAWLVIWIVSLFAARAGFVVAACPLWFLGLAAVLNLVAHPLLALRTGGYFPGVVTAPLVGVCGLVLLRELALVTARDG